MCLFWSLVQEIDNIAMPIVSHCFARWDVGLSRGQLRGMIGITQALTHLTVGRLASTNLQAI